LVEQFELLPKLLARDLAAQQAAVSSNRLIHLLGRFAQKFNAEMADSESEEPRDVLCSGLGALFSDPDEAEPLLGVTALESVGILVVPANRTLKRLPPYH
jgi:hypothetical protein